MGDGPSTSDRASRIATIGDALLEQFGSDAVKVAKSQGSGATGAAAETWRDILYYVDETAQTMRSDNG